MLRGALCCSGGDRSHDLWRRMRPAAAISVFMSSSDARNIHPWGEIRLLNAGLIFLQQPLDKSPGYQTIEKSGSLQIEQSAKRNDHISIHLS